MYGIEMSESGATAGTVDLRHESAIIAESGMPSDVRPSRTPYGADAHFLHGFQWQAALFVTMD
jgi:hypothetical protein